eukprot:TRINITY_DN62079_c0_g1_i1.p1 TRINITY_DN62079_c0_g1~~TRINITY_DN62079_c0_g1_i1.p1  ORF type:complete len:443 (+),score=82.72 TRINITY_DN62079_c0_g1_i1:115-1443(+)
MRSQRYSAPTQPSSFSAIDSSKSPQALTASPASVVALPARRGASVCCVMTIGALRVSWLSRAAFMALTCLHVSEALVSDPSVQPSVSAGGVPSAGIRYDDLLRLRTSIGRIGDELHVILDVLDRSLEAQANSLREAAHSPPQWVPPGEGVPQKPHDVRDEHISTAGANGQSHADSAVAAAGIAAVAASTAAPEMSRAEASSLSMPRAMPPLTAPAPGVMPSLAAVGAATRNLAEVAWQGVATHIAPPSEAREQVGIDDGTPQAVPRQPSLNLKVYVDKGASWGWTFGTSAFWVSVFVFDVVIIVCMQLFLESIGSKKGSKHGATKKSIAGALAAKAAQEAAQASAGGDGSVPPPTSTQRLWVLSQEDVLAACISEHWTKMAFALAGAVAFRLPQRMLSDASLLCNMLMNLGFMLRFLSLVLLLIRDDMTLPEKTRPPGAYDN